MRPNFTPLTKLYINTKDFFIFCYYYSIPRTQKTQGKKAPGHNKKNTIFITNKRLTINKNTIYQLAIIFIMYSLESKKPRNPPFYKKHAPFFFPAKSIKNEKHHTNPHLVLFQTCIREVVGPEPVCVKR